LSICVKDIHCGSLFTVIITDELSVYSCGIAPRDFYHEISHNDILCVPTIMPFFETNKLIPQKSYCKTKVAYQ